MAIPLSEFEAAANDSRRLQLVRQAEADIRELLTYPEASRTMSTADLREKLQRLGVEARRLEAATGCM